MGYESRLFIVERSRHDVLLETFSDKVYRWSELYAVFNLCKADKLPLLFRDHPADCYVSYTGKYLFEDDYGHPLGQRDVLTVTRWFRDIVLDDDYRRFMPVLGFLENMIDVDPESDTERVAPAFTDMVVLHYGY